jgi:methyl-accepting chemotaxis protein
VEEIAKFMLNSVKNIQTKFLLTVLPSVFITAFFFIIAGAFFSFQEKKQQRLKAIEDYATAQSFAVGDMLWSLRYEELEIYLNGMLKHPFISGISVKVSGSDRSFQLGLLTDKASSDDSYIVKVPIVHQLDPDKTRLGVLFECMEASDVARAILPSIFWECAMILMLVAIIIVGVVFAYRRTVGIPLKTFLRHIQNFQKRHAKGTVPVSSRDELGQVIEAYNVMLTQVNDKTNELENANLELNILNNNLEKALSQVKQLSGLLPICSYCKKIRDDKGYWNQIDEYLQDHTEAEFSHSICKECADQYYPDMDLYDDETQ